MIACFLLTVPEEDVIRLAAALYALYRAVNHYRFSGQEPSPYATGKHLKAFARRALEGHASFKLLLWTA
jgi:hypothetical protein